MHQSSLDQHCNPIRFCLTRDCYTNPPEKFDALESLYMAPKKERDL